MFKVVQNDSPLAARIAGALVQPDSRTNYNALAAAYNALTQQASQLVFPWKREKSGSLLQQLSERGLVRGSDFTLQFWLEKIVDAEGKPVLVDGKETHNENAVLTRVNFTTTMTITPAHKRGPRKAAGGTAAAPAGTAKPAVPAAAKK